MTRVTHVNACLPAVYTSNTSQYFVYFTCQIYSFKTSLFSAHVTGRIPVTSPPAACNVCSAETWRATRRQLGPVAAMAARGRALARCFGRAFHMNAPAHPRAGFTRYEYIYGRRSQRGPKIRRQGCGEGTCGPSAPLPSHNNGRPSPATKNQPTHTVVSLPIPKSQLAGTMDVMGIIISARRSEQVGALSV